MIGISRRYMVAALAAAGVFLAGCAGASHGSSTDERIVGVKFVRLASDVETAVSDLSEARINTVFTRTRIIEEQEGFVKLCHAKGMDVYAIFGVLIDAKAIREDPSLSQINALGRPMTARRKSYRLVCPNNREYRNAKIGTITDFLSKHPVDGLSLDFIRYGVEWEMIKPDEIPGPDQEYCFCPVCLEKFRRIRPLPRDKTTPELAQYILKNHRDAWTRFKCDSVTTLVRDIRAAAQKINPEIKIAVHALPWTEGDYRDGVRRLGGQDFRALTKYADLFSPMCYHYMLYRDTDSIRRQVLHMKRLGCRVAPCIQAGLIFRRDEGFTPAVFDDAMKAALASPSDGINLYTWRIFNAHPELRGVWLKNLRSH